MKTLKLLDFIETPAFALVFPDSGSPRIGFWNSRAEDVTGLTRDDVIGQIPTDVMGSLAEPLLSRTWIKETGEVRVDGLGSVNLVALPDEKTVIGTVMTAAQMAADRDREMFMGLAIHDARAPLRNISYLCEELLTEYTDPGDGRMQIVRKVRSLAEKSLTLSDEVLTSVQAASLPKSAFSEIELQPLCDLIFATLDPAGRHRLTCFNTMIEVERPVLQVVLRNLIDNAVQHGDSSAPLHIDVRVGAHPDGGLLVQVEDDGRGFSDASLAFFENGEIRRSGGFGLYGVRRILEARGGKIEVARQRNGKGSVVSATLPGHVITLAGEAARAS